MAPFDEPIVATDAIELAHVPPAGVAVSVVVVPWQIVPLLIADGDAFTVSCVVTKQVALVP